MGTGLQINTTKNFRSNIFIKIHHVKVKTWPQVCPTHETCENDFAGLKIYIRTVLSTKHWTGLSVILGPLTIMEVIESGSPVHIDDPNHP